MRVNGASVQLDGVCGSASGTTPLRYPPEGASLCSVGTANGVWGEDDRFAWQCQGEYGGNPSQCSAPRAYLVTTQATGGGSIASGREVTAGQQASFSLTIPQGYTVQASGCGGALSGSTFTTGLITGDCTISANFTPPPTHGACGDTAPSLNWPTFLCSAGSPANQINNTSDAFRWNCAGTHGGATVACQAPRQYTVTVNKDEGIANAQCSPNPVTFGTTTSCVATAHDPVGRPFSGWGGECSGTGSCMPLVFGPTTVSAHSAFTTYAISTSAVNGSVACSPNPVEHGQSASCTATPATGYHFIGWGGDCSGSGACQLNSVTGPRSVSATFALNSYTIATSGAYGTVQCTPNPVPHGQSATCTATANDNFHFTGWAGACTGAPADGDCQLANVTGPLSVTGNFTLNVYVGILTPSLPGGILDCTPSPVLKGRNVTCTATPHTGYDFTGWTDDCAGTPADSACILTNVTKNGYVSGTFTLKTHLITTSANNGSVVCTPNPVPFGEHAHCTPVPDAGYHFTGWAGACAGSGTCSLWYVTSPQNVSASFAINTYPITATAATGGSVDCAPNPVTHGQNAACTATPDAHYHFTGWTGDCTGTGACQLTNVTGPRSVGATFALNTYPINVSPTPVNGTVACTPNPVTHGLDTSCTATPDAGYHFTGWTGDCTGTGACQLTNVTSARSVGATFALNAYPINVNPTPTGGTVACTPNPVTHGLDTSCTATPDTGYHFTGWSGDCSGTGACQLTNVTGPRSVGATFALNAYPINVSPTPANGTVTCSPNPVTHGQDASCTATPAADYHLTGWTGDCSGTGACQLTNVTGPRSVGATFALNAYPINVSPTPANGTVACSPNPVTHGQDASCTATPDAGYHFTGWSGDCTGTGACQFTNVTASRTVSATFTPNTHAIATPAAANGTVTCTPNPVTHGQDASCTATPDAGYHFTGWTGDCTGTGACQFTNVTSPRSVSATFAHDPVDASCGSAANGAVAFKPSANLCATGTPGAVLSASGQYTWQCSGEYGGAAQQCSAPWQGAGGNGNLGAVEVDSANGWEISSAAFAATLPAPLPPHVRAVHAPLGLVLGRVAGNGDAQVTVRFTMPVPQGASYYKYGPSPDGLGCTGAACAQPHWYALPGAQFAPDGMSVTFTLTDGGVGDSDSVPHQITDPGVPVLLAPPAPQAPQAIPALGPWALALLSLLAAGLGAMRRRALL